MSVTSAITHHILVVDDDRLVLATLARGLRDAGYRVSEAANGEDGLELARSGQPDLALLDVRMPGMDGIELGRRLREHGVVPFIYLSAFGDADIVAQAAAHGALGYLVKPLDMPQILPSVQAALILAGEFGKLRKIETQLTVALAGNRDISMAVGVLMERGRVGHAEAFETLRSYARSERRKLQDVAKDMTSAVETINGVSACRHEDQ